MSNSQEYHRQHTQRFEGQLKELLRIPSVSTLSEHADDVRRAAQWLADDMRRIGFQTIDVADTGGHPVVYGEWLGASHDVPTVLVYCHYDVQPAAIEDGWDTAPFTPTERDGKIYARGAVDSKSHVMAWLKAAECVLADGSKSPVNIKLLFEGEEETASINLAQFIAHNRERLNADVCVISDGSMPDREQPAITYGLRGIVALEVDVTGPTRDLHSGHYGGSVHNPIQALSEILAQLHNDDGSVNVPGFYEDVLRLDDQEREELKQVLPWAETEWHAVTGAPLPWGEPDFTILERTGARPTLEINGISGGFSGEGVKTVLPAKASCKISCRLVNDQQPMHIYELVRDRIMKLAPPTVHVNVRHVAGIGDPVVIARNTPAMQATVIAYEKAWGMRPFFLREGGSVPIVADIRRELNVPIVLMPFGYKGCGAHGPNEHVYLDMWHKGINTAIHFFKDFTK